jgi:hypothetical protein
MRKIIGFFGVFLSFKKLFLAYFSRQYFLYLLGAYVG